MSSMTMPQPGLTQRRAQLEDCWRAQLERVTALSLAYYDAAQPGDGTVGGSRAMKQARELARRAAAERHTLAEIEAALARIASGHYGRCEQCREPISAALLARRPQARYCTACGSLASSPVM